MITKRYVEMSFSIKSKAQFIEASQSILTSSIRSFFIGHSITYRIRKSEDESSIISHVKGQFSFYVLGDTSRVSEVIRILGCTPIKLRFRNMTTAEDVQVLSAVNAFALADLAKELEVISGIPRINQESNDFEEDEHDD